MRFVSCAASHPGAVRSHNEDSFVDRPDLGLWGVADGAGGHQSGDLASAAIRDALAAIPPGLPPGALLAEARRAVADAHDAVRAEAARRGPGTVIASTVAVLLAEAGHFACLWAGDSRVYLLRAGELRQVSHDHSLVQELVDAGRLSADEAERHPRANVITRAVGIDGDTLELDKVVGRIEPGDRFLLCSDGLFKALAHDAVAAGLAAADFSNAATRLIEAALAERASDNVTAVAVAAFADSADGP